MTEGERLEDTGQLAEAVRMYRRAMTALRQPPLGRAWGRAMTALGHVQEGRDAIAPRCALSSAPSRFCEAISGPRSIDTAAALNGLGVCYKYLARYDEAEALYRRALGHRLTWRTTVGRLQRPSGCTRALRRTGSA